jgi:hypothetical protein
MFVRIRQSGQRLQASLVETRRIGGKVLNGHVAGLGSIAVALTPADRIVFWTKLHQRLAALANRLDGGARGKVLAAIHARIPMPTLDDQRAVQLQNAKQDADLWATLRDAHTADIEGQKELIAAAERAIAEREAAVADVTTRTKAAEDRVARIERGEDAGGMGQPLTRKDLIAALGWKPSDIRHALRLVEIEERGGNDDLMAEIMKRQRRTEKAASRAVLTRQRRS